MGMNSSAGKDRRATLSEINVTPLVDVMLVLLIMFMVTAPLMQQGLQVELPKTKSTGMDLPEEPFVIAVTQDQKIEIAKQEISISDLSERISSIFKTRKNKQVFIQADKQVIYGFVAEVMAEVKAAGITSIGLVTLPK